MPVYALAESPTQTPPDEISGLALWLKADSGLTVDGDALTTWTSQDDGAFAFSNAGSQRPTVATLSDLPAVQFTAASSQYLTCSSVVSISNIGTVVMLIELGSSVAVAQVLCGISKHDGTDYIVFLIEDGGCPAIASVRGAAFAYSVCRAPVFASTKHVLSFISDGTNYRIRVDGRDLPVYVHTVPDGVWFADLTGPTVTTIGARSISGAPDMFFTGKVTGLAVFDAVLTQSELGGVERYMASGQRIVRNNPWPHFADVTQYAGNPVIPRGAPGSWNENYADTPYYSTDALISGVHHTITQGSSLITDFSKLGLYTSSDLRTWTQHGSNPVIVGDAGEWDESYLLHPSMISIGGELRVYYSGKAANGDESIGYAVADDSTFTSWTKHAGNPVIGVGYAVPHVVDNPAGGYWCYCTYRLGPQMIIVRFASTDGITWTGPTTILAPTVGKWDEGLNLFDSWYTYRNGLHELWYVQWLDGVQQLCFAASPDGTNWYKYYRPVYTSGGGGVGDASIIVEPNQLVLAYAEMEADPWYATGRLAFIPTS